MAKPRSQLTTEGPELPASAALEREEGHPLIVLALAEWALGMPLGGQVLAAPGLAADHPLVSTLTQRGAQLVNLDPGHGPVDLLVTSGWLEPGPPPGTGAGQATRHVQAAAWMRPGGVAVHHLPSRHFRLRRDELVALGWHVLRGPSTDPPAPALQKARSSAPRSRRRQMVRYHLGNLLVLVRQPCGSP